MLPARTQKILIADDEAALRLLVRVTLESSRFEILEADNGEWALQQATTHLPDLTFLDWAMPGMSGIDVCRRLRANPATSGLTIVMLTARSQAFDRAAAIQAGVDSFVTKPFSPLHLLDIVRDKLGVASLSP